MISGCADDLVEASIMKLGAVELMKKPIRRQELVDQAARVVGG
jgi:hypothetical protein